MEESVLSLILRLRKQGSAAKEVKDELDDIKKSGKSLIGGLADVKAGFDMAFGAAQQVMGYAQQAFDATIGKAAAWGDSMGDLAQLTGTTVKETSELAATFELLGVKQESLGKIVKAFTTQGLQPTMANVRALAAEYQAIQDPVERNEFLFKRFGKQTEDVAEILGKSTSELDEFTAAARASGKVIDEEAAEAAERFNVQLAKLQQRAEGAGIALGNVLIPPLVDTMDAVDDLTAAQQRGDISMLEYINRLAGLATGHENALTLTRGLKDATEEATVATSSATSVTQEQIDTYALLRTMYTDTSGATGEYSAAQEYAAQKTAAVTAEAERYAQANAAAVKALGDLQAKQDTWASGTAGEVIAALNAAGIEGQEYTAALIAADTVLGTSLAQDEAKKAKLEELTQSYADGKIGVEEYRAGLNLLYAKDMPETISAFQTADNKARDFDEKLRRLENRRVTTYVETVYQSFGAEPGAKAPVVVAAGADVQVGDRRQAGGPVMVGERGAEMFWPQTNGYVMNNNDMRRMITALEAIASGGGGRGGVVNMSFNTQAAPSETMVGGYLRALAGAL